MKIRTFVAAGTLAAATIVGVQATPAFAGCNINLSLHNSDSVASSVDWSQSKVKIQGGLWATLGNGSSTIQPGATLNTVANTTFNCGANRRWQFHFDQGGMSQTKYNPSSTGWTTSQNINVTTNFP
jgi:hypothetical protein